MNNTQEKEIIKKVSHFLNRNATESDLRQVNQIFRRGDNKNYILTFKGETI